MAEMLPMPSSTPESRATVDTPSLTPSEQATLLRAVMQRQAALSIRGAAVFLGIILGLPLVNWKLPELANTNVGGFTLTWLFLGLLFYPITWLLSGWFIRASDRVEAELSTEFASRKTEGGTPR